MILGMKKNLLITVGACLVLAIGFGVWTYFTFEKIAEEEQLVIAKETEVTAAKSKIAKIPEIEKRVVILRENLREYLKVLPNSTEINEFIRQLYGFQEDTGVEITKLTNNTKNQRGMAAAKNDDAGFDEVNYKIDMNGNLWEFLSFLHRLESFERFVRVPSINIASGKREEDLDPAKTRHKIAIEIETFLFNPQDSSKPVEIGNYDKKVADLQEQIIRARQTIVQEPYDYHGPRGRRDPFIDPRLKVAEGDGQEALKRQQNLIEKLRAEVVKIGQMVVELDRSDAMIKRFELRRDIERATQALFEEVQRVEKEGLITYLPLVRRLQRDVVDSLVALKSRFGPDGLDAGPSKDELEEIAKRMEIHLKDGDFAIAMDRYDLIAERMQLVKDDKERASVIEQIKKMYHQAKLALEFGEKKLDVQGVIVSDEGSVALINGRAFSEGDFVDDELVVVKIFSDAIEFQFRDVVISKKI